MSLAINTTTPSGIVLAADSRQSYRNRKGMARIGSDNASKIFQLNARIGMTIKGLAFLPENGVLKNINNFVDEFKQKQGDGIEKKGVKELAEELHKFFVEKHDYKSQFKVIQEAVKRDLNLKGLELVGDFTEKGGFLKFRFKDAQGKEHEGAAGSDQQIHFMIAGYNTDRSHEVYIGYVPGKLEKKRDSEEKGKEYGASWIGQHDVVARIVLGRDWRLNTLPFVQEAMGKSQDVIMRQLNGLEYQISWGTMTLQDAIDFCVLAIQTTSAIQRFSDGVAMDPGDMPGVGGPVDAAVITPDKGFFWAKRKKLQVDDYETRPREAE